MKRTKKCPLTLFYRDADETIAWIMEKDAILSTDDYGRDLASVQALRRKHEGVERDLAALNEKVRNTFMAVYGNTLLAVLVSFTNYDILNRVN